MFNAIREFFAKSKQGRIMANIIDPWMANRPLAEVWDSKRFAEEGYRRNSIIFSCVVMKMTSFAQPELCAYIDGPDGEQELPEGHVLNGILGSGLLSGYQKAGVIPRGSQTNFMRTWSMMLDVAGNAYAFIVRNGAGMPLQVKLLSRPDLMKPVPDNNGDIWEYEYGRMPNVQHIPAGDIIHEMANPDPLNPFQGLSPIAVLARMGDLDNYAADYLRAFFLNAGIPALLAKFKQETPPDIMRRFKEQWGELYSGIHGWHGIAAVEAGELEIEEIGSKVRTMDLTSIFSETESRICGVFGVQPILVGAWVGLLHMTMANYEQSRKALYADTLLPVWTSTADRFTTDLAAEFGDNIVLEFDLDDVPELQRDKTEDKKLALEGWDRSLLTRKEAREVWGLEANADDDVYKVGAGDAFEPAGVIPVAASSQQKRIASPERLHLIGGHEQHDAVLAQQAKLLHNIADAASPIVKKKY